MNKVLYYSGRESNSIDLINGISKLEIIKEIHFVCIDNITVKNNRKYAILSNGYETLLPTIIKSVPSMLITTRGNMIIEGGPEIYEELTKSANNRRHPMSEPTSFSMNEFGGVSSSSYSSINNYGQQMTESDGNNNSCGNFASYGANFSIETPKDTYESNKIKDNISGSYNPDNFENNTRGQIQEKNPNIKESFQKMQEIMNNKMENSMKNPQTNSTTYNPKI